MSVFVDPSADLAGGDERHAFDTEGVGPVGRQIEHVDVSDQYPLTTLLLSQDMILLVDGNGEVVGVHGAPGADQTTAEGMDQIVSWYGPRRKRAVARLAGLEAEHAALIREINEHYTPLIKRQKGLIAWLDGMYREPLRALASRLLAGQKSRSVKVGLLNLSFRKKPERVEVVDAATAVQWARLACPDAVKVEETVLVSMIPDALRRALPGIEGASGLRLVPPSDVFKVE